LAKLKNDIFLNNKLNLILDILGFLD